MRAAAYLALLSHSGSRGTGAQIAQHYSRLARELHPELPQELSQLAWLDLSTEAGQEYWAAMELMGRYAAANHALIHAHIARALGVRRCCSTSRTITTSPGASGIGFPTGRKREVIVHRKGATPAGAGVLGIIPGLDGHARLRRPRQGRRGVAEFRVARRGPPDEPHEGEDRLFTWDVAQRFLRERGVTLLSAGLDEVPMAYKDIDEVMAAQSDLVEPLARFDPRLVKMAPSGEPPED